MNVLGVGLDLVEVEPFARQLTTPGSGFAAATFTPGELDAAESAGPGGSPGQARHLAARFAAKEAFVKAWAGARRGSHPVMAEVAWQDLEVSNDRWGRPVLTVAGGTARALERTLGPIDAALSLTHEDTVAGAVVVLSGGDHDGAPR